MEGMAPGQRAGKDKGNGAWTETVAALCRAGWQEKVARTETYQCRFAIVILLRMICI